MKRGCWDLHRLLGHAVMRSLKRYDLVCVSVCVYAGVWIGVDVLYVYDGGVVWDCGWER